MYTIVTWNLPIAKLQKMEGELFPEHNNSFLVCNTAVRENIFAKMLPDDATLAARNDPLIVTYGEKLFEKMGHEKHKHRHIKQKVKDLGKFLCEMLHNHAHA